MLFVKVDDLKAGMRLARPVYNRNGALIYERNAKLPPQGIYSIKNFGLIGLYILEPAEPLPPMTPEDIEFERFQTMSVFTIKDDFKDVMIRKKEPSATEKLVINIIKQYGNLDHKINFFQNLRSKEDYVYKHALSSAILCALISNKMKISRKDQINLIKAAIFHRIGEVLLPLSIKNKTELNDEDVEVIKKCIEDGLSTLKVSDDIKNIIKQANNPHTQNDCAKILKVASDYDSMTAMNFMQEPMSEITALNKLGNEKKYDKKVVDALIKSINILQAGVCVELSNNEKGLVIKQNNDNILRPVVLSFNKNKIYDLSIDSVFVEIQIKDIMKTMDNRAIIDQKRLSEYS